MGLACSNIRLLTLTARKSDCEYNISIDSMEKMALTREQSELSKLYSAKLQNKSIAYYNNGKYNQMTYQYLMGYGANFASIINDSEKLKNYPLKDNNSMILTDYQGYVVMNEDYKNAIIKVLGSDAVDALGRGSTFSKDKIPAILAQFLPGNSSLSLQSIEAVANGGEINAEFDANIINTLSGNPTGTTITKDNTTKATEKVSQIIQFYYPIFLAASANGWTSEYNNEMAANQNYISDALVSGSFQLAQVGDFGDYDPNASLTYFIMHGLVVERTDSDVREEITAWYNAEKERIAEKENFLDIELADLSTELEAINTELESLKSLMENNIDNTFNWGT